MMEKEIKVINIVFSVNNKLNLISIEQFINYDLENAKIKFLLEDKYIEKKVYNMKLSDANLVFDNVFISPTEIEVHYDNIDLTFKVNCLELIKEFLMESKGKNHYILFEESKYEGKLNGIDVSGKLFLDFERIVNICDEYFKVFCLDFNDFSGVFTMVSQDFKSPNIYLKYKDCEYKNKKTSTIYEEKILKMSTYKYIVRSSNYFKLNIKTNKTYKAESSIIPFKYQKGSIRLVMKKNLFKKKQARRKADLFYTL